MTQGTEFKQGDMVVWDWGQGTACGVVAQRFTNSITKSIKGTDVTRHGSKDTPAPLIEQENGNKVLKLCTEVRSA